MDQMEQKEQKTIIRVCKQCNEVKDLLTMFPKNRNNTQNITYRHRCVDCEKIIKTEQNRRYYSGKKMRAKEPKTSECQ